MVEWPGRASRKAGQPPGTLAHVGERHEEEVKVSLMDYNADRVEERVLADPAEGFPYRNRDTVTWINVDGLHRVEVIKALGDQYGLHPLVLEDVLNTYQRPKVEDYADHLFIVIRMLGYDSVQNDIVDEQVSLVVGPHYVLSFQEREGDVFEGVRERIRSGRGRIRRMGPDYLAYALLDAVVDEYFPILESLGERTEGLEEELISKPTSDTLREIYNLKRDLIGLRKSVWPLREVTNRLERGESALIQPETMVFLRDVYDHTIQVIDSVEVHRELVSGMLDTYLSSLSNKMNEVMKVLTIIATIFIPLGFVAGLYGMNFAIMPELQLPWGYPLALSIMAAVAITMIAYFRRRRWL